MTIDLFAPPTSSSQVTHVGGFTLESFFTNSTSYLFLNEHLSSERKQEIHRSIQSFLSSSTSFQKPLFLIPTSGTTSLDLKIVILKKEDFLKSAQRANHFLESQSQDNWLISLPLHHVAGLSILARAYVGKNKVYYWPKWNPHDFVQKIANWDISFCSLVPTQIFDLLTNQLSSPKNIKHVLVGGSVLSDIQYSQMRDLRWPLIKTYGMTETSAFMSFSHGDQYYQPLPEVSVRLDTDQKLAVQCDSLFEGYLVESRGTWTFEPKNLDNGFWSTEDTVEFEAHSSSRFRVLGRAQGMIKIKGELVNVNLLNSRLSELAAQKGFAAPVLHWLENERDENELFVILNSKQDEDTYRPFINLFNQQVLPFERIDWYIQVKEIPRTELGKVKISALNTENFKEAYRENRKSILD